MIVLRHCEKQIRRTCHLVNSRRKNEYFKNSIAETQEAIPAVKEKTTIKNGYLKKSFTDDKEKQT